MLPTTNSHRRRLPGLLGGLNSEFSAPLADGPTPAGTLGGMPGGMPGGALGGIGAQAGPPQPTLAQRAATAPVAPPPNRLGGIAQGLGGLGQMLGALGGPRQPPSPPQYGAQQLGRGAPPPASPAPSAAATPGAPPPAPAAPSAAAPAQPVDPWAGAFPGGFDPGTMGRSGQIQKRLAAMFGANAAHGNPMLWQEISRLMGQANQSQFDPERRAAFLAPRLEAMGNAEQQALSGAQRDAASRGLTESSFGAAQEGAIRGQVAAGRGNLISQLYQTEQASQQAAQEQLRSMLMQVVTGHGSQGGSMAMDKLRLQLERSMAEGGGFDVGGFLSGLGGLAGGMAQAGVKFGAF